ncbi:MAG TPA: nucleotidyltransferase family protein [Urbifossiella sp.]|jgi:NDP-sugar pyrophosphorylase family protein|nr:nucleotidyltransferase family protein [Urbifossiella sp.]
MDPLDGVTAAILAGGFGTRLRSVVADRPKVLAPVAGRPFLAHLLDRLAAARVAETVLLTGYGADQVYAAFGEAYRGMALRYSAEPAPLGTGGAVRHAAGLFAGEAVLLLNGDSFCAIDPAPLVAAVRADAGRIGLGLAWVEDVGRYGAVELDPAGRVAAFAEKGGAAGPGWINAGVYLIPRGRLADIPPGRPVSLEREVLPRWVESPGVRGVQGGRFIDIGTPDSFAAAEAFFADGPPG